MPDRLVSYKDKSTWIGTVVYRKLKPYRVGRIKEIPNPDGSRPVVKVKWQDGKETNHAAVDLMIFNTLVSEYEEKLEKYKGFLKAALDKGL